MFPGSIGYQELIVIGAIAVILFGGRLPEVARSIGQSYQQFRKGLSDLQSTINTDVIDSDYDTGNAGLPNYSDASDDVVEPTGPRFEPPEENE